MKYNFHYNDLHFERKNTTFLSYRKIFYVFLLLSLFTNEGFYAQGGQEDIIFTKSFTNALDQAGLEFYNPAETWLRIRPIRKDSFMQYNLILHNDPDDLELRIRINGTKRKGEVPAHVEFARLIASISSNLEEDSIKMFFSTGSFFKENYDADWGRIADFKPKKSYSDKPYGRIISLFKEDGTSADLILLSRQVLTDPELQPVYLKFKTKEKLLHREGDQ